MSRTVQYRKRTYDGVRGFGTLMGTPHELLIHQAGILTGKKGYDHRRRVVPREIGDAVQYEEAEVLSGSAAYHWGACC